MLGNAFYAFRGRMAKSVHRGPSRHPAPRAPATRRQMDAAVPGPGARPAPGSPPPSAPGPIRVPGARFWSRGPEIPKTGPFQIFRGSGHHDCQAESNQWPRKRSGCPCVSMWSLRISILTAQIVRRSNGERVRMSKSRTYFGRRPPATGSSRIAADAPENQDTGEAMGSRDSPGLMPSYFFAFFAIGDGGRLRRGACPSPKSPFDLGSPPRR